MYQRMLVCQLGFAFAIQEQQQGMPFDSAQHTYNPSMLQARGCVQTDKQLSSKLSKQLLTAAGQHACRCDKPLAVSDHNGAQMTLCSLTLAGCQVSSLSNYTCSGCICCGGSALAGSSAPTLAQHLHPKPGLQSRIDLLMPGLVPCAPCLMNSKVVFGSKS